MIKRLTLITTLMGTTGAMVFDNRFLPLYLKPFTRRCDALSHVRIQPFFMQADRAFSDVARAEIPDINGIYDQRVLAQALVELGKEEPLRSDFRLRSTLPWSRRGRLDAQGIAFLYEQALSSWFSFGVNALFAHVTMRHEFLLTGPESRLLPGDKEYLFQTKEKINQELGLCPPVFSKTGFGDIDLYVRFGAIWDYVLKCRRIDTSVKLGVLAPTAHARDNSNPASFSLGGDKHWGIYGGFETEWELKEDWSVGLLFRGIKRFEKTQLLRLPLLSEPQEYGALIGPVRVDPGWTFVVNPYVDIAGLREGLGFKALYTLVAHTRDSYADRRSLDIQRVRPSKLSLVEDFSSWGAEYVSIGAYYDFGKVWECPSLYPKISAYWDIPVNWLVSKRAAKTSAVSLMVECDF